jgi:hypothetical protein
MENMYSYHMILKNILYEHFLHLIHMKQQEPGLNPMMLPE